MVDEPYMKPLGHGPIEFDVLDDLDATYRLYGPPDGVSTEPVTVIHPDGSRMLGELTVVQIDGVVYPIMEEEA